MFLQPTDNVWMIRGEPQESVFRAARIVFVGVNRWFEATESMSWFHLLEAPLLFKQAMSLQRILDREIASPCMRVWLLRIVRDVVMLIIVIVAIYYRHSSAEIYPVLQRDIPYCGTVPSLLGQFQSSKNIIHACLHKNMRNIPQY